MGTSGSISEFLYRQSIALLLSFIIVAPFLTHYLSTTLFYRAVNRKAGAKRPPTVPYWFPVSYHSISLIARPSAYFAALIREYGQYSPFTVKSALASYVVIRNPVQVQNILQDSNHMNTLGLDAEVDKKIMSSSRLAIGGNKDPSAISEDARQVDQIRRTVARSHLTGPYLVSLANVYISIFRRNMSNKMFQDKTWTQIEDLWSFFQIEITRTTTEMLFGSGILKQYPKVTQDIWKFDAFVANFLPGMPRFAVSSADESRDRLLEGLKKWLQATHGGTDFAKAGHDDPVWDEKKGSKFIQDQDQRFANLPTFNYHARAVEALKIMHCSNSATMPSVFWHVVEIARNPTLLKLLTAEIAPYFDRKLGSYDVAAITSLPIMESIHAEVGRLRSKTCIIRTNTADSFKLDDEWSIPKGVHAIAFSHDLGLNTELWAKARRQTVAQPLEEFWAERFLIPDQPTISKKADRKRERIITGTFSLAELEGLHIPLLGGQQPIPGDLVKAIQAATTSILLAEYEIELCDPEATDLAIPPLRELAYGTTQPAGKIAIRIRKRNTSK